MRIVIALVGFLFSASALAQFGGDCLSQRFRPDFEPRTLEFGVDVAISEDHLLIVDRFSESLIYTYRRDAISQDWVLSHTVPGGSGGDVVLDGDRFITGDVQVERFGGARIYEFRESQWLQVAEIESPDDPRRTGWGENVAIHGDVAVVGNGGEALVVAREQSESWEQIDFLVSPDSPMRRSDFGGALAMDERFLIVGAPGEDLTGNQNGAIYIYEWGPDGRPALMQKLTPEPADVGPRLGTSLALDGNTLVAGAWVYEVDDEFVGAAQVYTFDGTQWSLEQRLVGPPAPPTPEFGWDVSIAGSVIAVGAPAQSAGPGFGRGAAHGYRRSPGGAWGHAATIAVDISARDYGESLNLGGGQLVVGASESFFMGENLGVADVYDLDCLLCAPDLDADGALTIFDFLLFFNAFDDGSSEADFDGDGELTIFDFLAFQTAFDAGCG